MSVGRAVPTRDLERGDVVLMTDPWHPELDEPVYALVDGTSPVGPALHTPVLDRPVLAGSVRVISRTSFDALLGIDGKGYTHLHDSDRQMLVVRSVDEVDHRQEHVGEWDLGDWIRFTARRRGWHEIAGRFLHVLEDGDRE